MLSFAEELLWQASRADSSAPPFFDCPLNVCVAVRLRSRPSHAGLEDSLNEVCRRHEVLRAAFPAVAGRPVRMLCEGTARPSRVDLSGVAGGRQDGVLARLLAHHATRPFDLGRGPLLRVALVTLGRDHHVLALVVHHIVFDGWSKRVLALELRDLYESRVAGRPAPVAPLGVSYRDYVEWQRRQLREPRGRAFVEFWRARLHALPDLALPADRTRQAAPSTRSGTCGVGIRPHDARRLRAISREHGVTAATAMLAMLKVFLHRLTGATDIAVGVPVSDRRRHEFEALIGLFTNVVVVRSSIADSLTFAEVLAQVQLALSDAYSHQDVPYGYLTSVAAANGPLYRVGFNFVPAIPAAALVLPGVPVEPLRVAASPRALADLSLQMQSQRDGFEGLLIYKADLFSAGCVRRLAHRFESVVAALLDAPGERLSKCLADLDACCA